MQNNHEEMQKNWVLLAVKEANIISTKIQLKTFLFSKAYS